MKNKILYLLTICICGCMSMFGQTDNAKTMKQLDASADDYIPLLNGSGYEAFTFDISSLSDGQYNINFKIKEYKDGNEVTGDLLGGYSAFPNMLLLSQLPEMDQEIAKHDAMADPDRGIFRMSEKISVGFSPVVNDSIKPMMFKVDNIGMRPINLPMMPQYENNDSVNGKKIFMYYAKPFKTGEIVTGRFLPLVLLGSMWYDESIGFHRFCGEKEIDPDMSSKILKYIPHYYVIGIEVNPIKML